MKPTSKQVRVKAFKACRKLAGKHDILEEFAAAIRANGTVGETRNLKLLYLAGTSRLLQRPVSIVVKGGSSGGKSTEVKGVLAFFPQAAYREYTKMSPKALVHAPEGSFRHRMLVFYEFAGIGSDELSHFVRTLLSEDRIRYEVVVSGKGGHTTKVIEQEGPTGLITTTTRPELHEENETRVLTLHVADSREHTLEILMAQAEAATGNDQAKPDLVSWRALQTWLSYKANCVEIPFAPSIASLIPPVASRLHRDHPTLLSLIRANALLHQRHRDRTPSGAIEATIDDYRQVYLLTRDIIAEAVDATVPTIVREAIEAVRRLLKKYPAGVGMAALSNKLERDRSSISRRVQIAVHDGYLRNLQTRAGVSARLVMGDPLPCERVMLPSPKAVEKRHRKNHGSGKQRKRRYR